MMDQLVKSPDFTWAMAKVFVWSCCEPFIGIVCACLPTYAPLVRRLWRRDGGYSNSGGPGMSASDKSKSANKRTNWSMSSWKNRTTAFRGEDEMELTVNTAITADSDKKSKLGDLSNWKKDAPAAESSEIVVTKDFYWSDSA
jgi:hypothetical protein